MAKAKIDFKQIMLEKGEKYGLIAGVLVMVLLIVWGIMQAAGSASTDEKARTLTDKASKLKKEVNNKNSGQAPEALNPDIMGVVAFNRIPPEMHRNDPYYVDLDIDSVKRGRPRILPPTEYQVDFFRGVMLSYNFVKGADGERKQIYVVRDTKKEKNQSAQRINDRFKDRKPAAKAPATRPSGPGPGGPGMGGPGMGGPGMGGPGMGGPGMGGPGMGGPGGPGMGGGLGGGPGGGIGGPSGPGMPGQGGVASAETVKTIEALDLKKFLEEQGKGYVPAQFIRPLQCVIVQASIPWKQQLEEYAKALRYNSVDELMHNQADLPHFEGIKVQRKVYYPNGKSSEWLDYDWAKKYEEPIYIEKIDEDQPEPDDLKIVTPPEDTELFVPYPKLARGHYPEVRLTSIRNSIDKAKMAGGKQFQPSGKQGGEGGIWKRGGGDKLREADKGKEKEQDKGNPADSILDSILIRFLDVDVTPGYSYEYRIQIKVQNPNYGKRKEVNQPDHASAKELFSEPVTVAFKDGDKDTTIVKVPTDRHLYAFSSDTKEVLKSADHTKLQVHAWMSHIRTDRTRAADEKNLEPLGEWLVEDVQAARGQWIWQVKNVRVPIWSAKDNGYHFIDFAAARSGATRVKGALPVDVSAQYVVVDYTGGRFSMTVRGSKGMQPRDVTDDSGLEMLLLGEDGKLRCRQYWTDMAEPDRFERETAWTSWLKSVKEGGDPKKDGPANPFDKPGGGKGPGS